MCTDIDNQATDGNGFGCSEYRSTSWLCGEVDDDFNSTMMCCGCGGGRKYGNSPKTFSIPLPFVIFKYTIKNSFLQLVTKLFY